MKFDAPANNHKAKTCAGDLADVAAAVEGLKEMFLVGFRNAATVIGDATDRGVTFARDGEINGLAGCGVFYGI